MALKILYHHRTIAYDGQKVHIDEMINAFQDLGHQIIIVQPDSQQEKKYNKKRGFFALLKANIPAFLYELLEASYAIIDFIRLYQAYKKYKPDCIYERYNLYLPSGIWLKKWMKIPLLLEVNSPLYDERKKHDGVSLNWLAKWSERYVWQNADYLLPVTHVLSDYLLTKKIPPEKIKVIANAINPAHFSVSKTLYEAKSALGFSSKIVLGFIGFIRQWHQLDRVLEFIKESTGVHLLVIGDGPALEQLKRQVEQWHIGDDVTFVGVLTREHINPYLAAFDIALQPYVVAYASPLKLFEYMMMGRAIIAPDTDNIKEILTHQENALLFQSSDQTDFLRQLNILCEDANLRRTLGDNARQTIVVKKLTWDNNAQKVVALFNACFDASP